MKETAVLKPILRITGVLAFSCFVIFGSACFEARQIVWRRDGGKCRDCGKKKKDGYYLEISHNDHTRNEYYDKPSNLKLLCLLCHRMAHIRRAGRNGLSLSDNQRAIELIERRMVTKKDEGFKI